MCFEMVDNYRNEIWKRSDKVIFLDDLWLEISEVQRKMITLIRKERGIKDKLGPSKHRNI